MSQTVLCLGEVLWDALPAGLFLGGAPYNVAHHLRQLGRGATLVSRVGDDVLGREALRRLRRMGCDTEVIQRDTTLPTGFVEVTLDAAGTPIYEIAQLAAWDAIASSTELRARAKEAQAVVFGSLAQRRTPSRETIQTLAEAAAFSVFDVNLRPPFDDRSVVESSLRLADGVKLNEEEVWTVAEWFDLSRDGEDRGPAAERRVVQVLAERFGCQFVCLTRGARGAAFWHDGGWSEHSGHPTTVRDTVGAGDAFLAGLLDGLLAGQSDADALDRAARLGAYVASQPGATPTYDLSDVERATGAASDAESQHAE